MKVYRFEITTEDRNNTDPEKRIHGMILEKEYYDGASIDKGFWRSCQWALMEDHAFYASDTDITIGILSCNGRTICGLGILHSGSFLEPSRVMFRMGMTDLRYPCPNKKPYDYYLLRENVWAE